MMTHLVMNICFLIYIFPAVEGSPAITCPAGRDCGRDGGDDDDGETPSLMVSSPDGLEPGLDGGNDNGCDILSSSALLSLHSKSHLPSSNANSKTSNTLLGLSLFIDTV